MPTCHMNYTVSCHMYMLKQMYGIQQLVTGLVRFSIFLQKIVSVQRIAGCKRKDITSNFTIKLDKTWRPTPNYCLYQRLFLVGNSKSTIKILTVFFTWGDHYSTILLKKINQIQGGQLFLLEVLASRVLHWRKLTCPLKIDGWKKMYFLLKIDG